MPTPATVTNRTAIPYAPISEEEENKLNTELSRLRRGIFDCDDDELTRRHARMDEIKAICACNWDSRSAQHIANRLASMGY